MKFDSVKRADQLKLDGVSFQLEFLDKELTQIVMTDGSGNIVKVAKNGYSYMQAYIPAKPEIEKKWRVSGSVGDIGKVQEDFKNQYDAESRKTAIESDFPYSDKVKIEVAEVDVEIPF